MMNVLIKISESLDKRQVEDFLAGLRIPNLDFQTQDESSEEAAAFRIKVEPASHHWNQDEINIPCKVLPESVLLFNSEADVNVEPKVIYTTDHSARAEANLESFKRMRPYGFAGAVVVEDTQITSEKDVWKDKSHPFVNQVAAAVLATRANLIIANFDCSAAKQVARKLAGLAQLTKPNRCHVLILKA